MSKKKLFKMSLGTNHKHHDKVSGLTPIQLARVALLFEERVNGTDQPGITLRLSASKDSETVIELNDGWEFEKDSFKHSHKLDRAMLLFSLSVQAIDALSYVWEEQQ